MPRRTSLLRSVTTSTPVTRRCTSAAAAYQRELAESLVAKGADVRARNRRGAEPLHYAADGGPDAEQWDPAAQRDVIAYLIEAGADPNALDKSGVAPLHRAVRNRCSAAVSALIDNGADPLLMNKNGSTPLHLAVQNTGKSNSGSAAAKTNRAGSSPCSSDTARVRPMPMRTARPSRPRHPVTGSVICSTPLDGQFSPTTSSSGYGSVSLAPVEVATGWLALSKSARRAA